MKNSVSLEKILAKNLRTMNSVWLLMSIDFISKLLI